MFSFLTTVKTIAGEKKIFSGEKMEIYVPKMYFDSQQATLLGDEVSSVGLFFFRVFANDTSSVKSSSLYEMQLPVQITFGYSEKENRRFKIKPEFVEDSYVVFTLYKGDEFLTSTKYKKSVDDILYFITKLLHNGKIPPTVSYEDVLNIIINVMDITDTKLGVPLLILEVIVSEIYRDKKNTTIPFRKTYVKGKTSPYGYKTLRLTKIPEMNSTFAGLTAEDVGHQIPAAILRNRQGKPEAESPVEKVIKY